MRHHQVDRADIGQHRLPGGAVAVVAAAPPGWIMFLITQVAGHLLSQRPLQHGLGSPETTGHQGRAARRLPQQLISELLIDQRPRGRPITALGFAGHHRSV